jgi:hypothetical protein
MPKPAMPSMNARDAPLVLNRECGALAAVGVTDLIEGDERHR